MSINSTIAALLTVFVCVAPDTARSETPDTAAPDTSTAPAFHLTAELGAGYSYKVTTPKLTLGTYTRDGVSGTVRITWGKSRLLGVGMETGWIPLSSTTNAALAGEFGPLRLDAALTAIPVLAIVSVQPIGIQLHAGIGYYRVSSVVTVGGTTSESSEWDLGYMASLGYTHPLHGDHRIGVEVRYNNITEQQITTASVHLRYLYRLF